MLLQYHDLKILYCPPSQNKCYSPDSSWRFYYINHGFTNQLKYNILNVLSIGSLTWSNLIQPPILQQTWGRARWMLFASKSDGFDSVDLPSDPAGQFVFRCQDPCWHVEGLSWNKWMQKQTVRKKKSNWNQLMTTFVFKVALENSKSKQTETIGLALWSISIMRSQMQSTFITSQPEQKAFSIIMSNLCPITLTIRGFFFFCH